MKLQFVKTTEFFAEPNTELAVCLEEVAGQFEAFKEANPEFEFLGALPVGPVKEGNNWGFSIILFYAE